MGASEDPSVPVDHEAAYADFLSRRAMGEDLDLARFCEEVGLDREALAEIDRQWQAFQAPNADTVRPSLSERIRGAFGPSVDPEIELDPEREAAEAVDELVGRLRRRKGSFGRHEIKSEIGKGGMGYILAAWDQDLRRNLAMKVMRWRQHRSGTELRPNARHLGRFLEEAQITSQLDHPGIVPVHDLGLNDEGRLYFTMKLVKGHNFDRILDFIEDEKSDWNVTRGLGVILKVCEAMAYAHRKGVIHRDLKPANIMVGQFGEVYVMDWGLAKVLGRKGMSDIRLKINELGSLSIVRTDRRDLAEMTPSSPLMTLDGDVLGTPCYMPPEQARGDVDAMGPASDVYSIGAILYSLLTGQHPYVKRRENVDPFYTLSLIQQGPPAPVHQLNPRVPAELVAICEKAMAREASDRYRDTMEMADDLRAYMERRVVRAYETGAAAEFKKWVSRNRALAMASAAGLVLVIGVLAVISWIQASQKRELQQLSDYTLVDSLEARAEQLWRALGATEADLQAWIREAEAFVQRRELHEASLAEIRSRSFKAPKEGRPDRADHTLLEEKGRLQAIRDDLSALLGSVGGPSADAVRRELDQADKGLAEVEEDLAEIQAFTFATTADQWRHDQLVGLIERIDDFEEDSGALEQVRSRLDYMQTVRRRSFEEAKRAWDEAIASIANPDDCPAYGGQAIVPQLGLVPIGRDPASGLWEFAHLQSGVPPIRLNDGKLQINEETGLVFVLLPGGEYHMGATAEPTGDGERVDPGAKTRESPINVVTLDPFFISKYEMTQAQWLRLTGDNPATWSPESSAFGGGYTLRHPVETVKWDECHDLMRKAGLALPTEAQWEYAARGGVEAPWSSGPDPAALADVANLMDLSNYDVLQLSGWPHEAWRDGFITTAPVGSLQPNPYGLHDVHGNVWEWCEDMDADYHVPTRKGTGQRLGYDKDGRIYRGGAFYNVSSSARLTNRFPIPGFYNSHGLRPARALER